MFNRKKWGSIIGCHKRHWYNAPPPRTFLNVGVRGGGNIIWGGGEVLFPGGCKEKSLGRGGYCRARFLIRTEIPLCQRERKREDRERKERGNIMGEGARVTSRPREEESLPGQDKHTAVNKDTDPPLLSRTTSRSRSEGLLGRSLEGRPQVDGQLADVHERLWGTRACGYNMNHIV